MVLLPVAEYLVGVTWVAMLIFTTLSASATPNAPWKKYRGSMLRPCFWEDRFKGVVWVATLFNMKDIDEPILNKPQHVVALLSALETL